MIDLTNVFKKRIIFLPILLFLLIEPSLAIPILRTGSDQSATVNIDNRFGADYPKSGSSTFYIYNDDVNDSMIVSTTVSSPGSGISMGISPSQLAVPPGGYGVMTVSYTVPSSVSSGTYTGIVSVSGSGVSGSMNLVLTVITKIPAKLDAISSISSNIKFDKPKGSVATFQDSETITLKNIGDSILYIDSIIPSNPNSDITFSISNIPSSISPRNNGIATILISAKSSSYEGSSTGNLVITSRKERMSGTETQNVGVSVTIEYGVDMVISKSSLDFGETELLKPKENYIDITETLGYKSINAIKVSKSTGPDKWLSFSKKEINSIFPFGTDRINLQLLYDGEAKPYEDHKWTYIISSNNAGTKSIDIKSKMIFDPEPQKVICSQKYANNDKLNEIAGKMCNSLTFGVNNAGKTFKIPELIQLYSITRSTIDLLDSYNSAENFINNGEHDNAYDHLLKGVVAAKIINTYSDKVSDNNVKQDVDFVNERSGNLMNSLLKKENEYYVSMKDSDLLQSMIANERLSDMWGILGNEALRQKYSVRAKEKFEQHNSLVDSAKNTKLEAENSRRGIEDAYLSKWGGMNLLINPFYFSKVSSEYNSIISKYEDAINNYKLAGEKESANKTGDSLNEIISEFNTIKNIFFVFTAFYALVFLGILSTTTKAMMAYIRDSSETRMGDNFV